MITAITANTNYSNLGFKGGKSTNMKFFEKFCLMKPEEEKAFVDFWNRKYSTYLNKEQFTKVIFSKFG